MVIGVKNPRVTELTGVAETRNAVRTGFGFAERRQKQRRENGDQGDDNQEFDQRESATSGKDRYFPTNRDTRLEN
jgi:hypothetical protein